MGRKGVRKLESMTAKDGRVVDIMFESETALFSAYLDGKTLTSESVAELRRDLYKYLTETENITWTRVIEITMQGGYFRDDASVFGFDMHEFFVSSHVSNHYLTAPKIPDNNDTNLLARRGTYWHKWSGSKPFKPPCKDGNDIYLIYTPEAWRALTHLQEKCRKLREDFQRFVMTAGGIQRLNEIGAALPKLLPEPGQDDKED